MPGYHEPIYKTIIFLLSFPSLSFRFWISINSSTEKGSVIELVAEADLYFQRTLYDIPVAITFSLRFEITPRA
jgi:hypothetical protein